MDLNQSRESRKNLLPVNGLTTYTPIFIKEKDNSFYQTLFETVQWKHDELTLYSKKIITKRKVAFEGDEQIEYTYSKQQKIANPWSNVVLELKQKLEKELNTQFNG